MAKPTPVWRSETSFVFARSSPQSQWLVPLTAAAGCPASTWEAAASAMADERLAALPVHAASLNACSHDFMALSSGCQNSSRGRNRHACERCPVGQTAGKDAGRRSTGKTLLDPRNPPPPQRPPSSPAQIPPAAGVLLLLLTSTLFASNHIAARLAFDHGTSVATAVAVRSATTVLSGTRPAAGDRHFASAAAQRRSGAPSWSACCSACRAIASMRRWRACRSRWRC